MKSFKNHFSLVVALLSILLSIQIFIIVDRSIEAYKENLSKNYSVIVVSKTSMDTETIFKINPMISDYSELSVDDVIKRLNSGINDENMQLLKVTLPKFYKLKLSYFPSPEEIEKLRKDLLQYKNIIKIEDFSNSHDTTYKLLLLFKSVVTIFAIVIFVVTTLLIFKELRIWQFKHSERMSIMGLFGAPVWLRSAVLFRLAIVNAIVSSLLAFGIFSYFSSSTWVKEEFKYIGIDVVIFDFVNDFFLLFCAALFISILLASLIVLGHKEEV